jgi:N4-gp56 family major capsid protein
MLNYNAPADGQASTIDAASGAEQMRTFYYLKKAIVTARRQAFFSQLAPSWTLPMHFGKAVRVHEYIPLLDDRNVNDQGLDASGATIANGNLYGSSRDVGKVTSKIPFLTENGGRVNRVGFTRIVREGTLHKFGIFMEHSDESVKFDSDDQLMDYLSTELMNGAVQMTEAILQLDLLAAAGVVVYGGAAVSQATITGETVFEADGTTVKVPNSEVVWDDFIRLEQVLTDNRTPKQTKVFTGSRNVDTRTLPASRIMYVGSELVPTLRDLKTNHGKEAFLAVQHYADQGNIILGEVGSIYEFRIIQVQEMLRWEGEGAEVVSNPGYRASTKGGKLRYDVYPMLVVGDDSFVTIGFQTDGKAMKFNIITKMPGQAMARPEDPYGETGFSSMKWYYGILIRRPERIALIKTVART